MTPREEREVGVVVGLGVALREADNAIEGARVMGRSREHVVALIGHAAKVAREIRSRTAALTPEQRAALAEMVA